ncbi:MAG TPA: hypothetical protein VIV12_28520 [Streptosporangiaceae bacterium]
MNPTEHTAAVNVLERLAAELDPRAFASTLVAGEGKVPCLSVASRNAGLAEDIYAQNEAAAKVAGVLRLISEPAAHGR